METFSALLTICAGNSPVPGEFPAQRPVTRSFDVFFDLSLKKRLSKQWWGWWFETPSCSLWRQCSDSLKNVSSGPIDKTSPLTYRQTCKMYGTLVGNKIVDHSDVVGALLQLHLASRLNTLPQWTGQRQLQDETRNIYVLEFGATYIIGLVVGIMPISWKKHYNADLLPVAPSKINLIKLKAKNAKFVSKNLNLKCR